MAISPPNWRMELWSADGADVDGRDGRERMGRTWTDVDGRDGTDVDGRDGRGRTGRTWTDGTDVDGRDGTWTDETDGTDVDEQDGWDRKVVNSLATPRGASCSRVLA